MTEPSPPPPESARSRVVPVRALCDFTARRGDLDLRFTPSPTAQQGIAGHQWVAARRPPGYEREVPLSASHGGLTVRGRADGFDAAAGRLEEVKTHRGDLSRQPGNHRHLHWAQAHVYGHMLCQSRGLASLRIALVYLDLGTMEETVVEETREAAELRRLFEGLCERYAAWAGQEEAHRRGRDAALAALRFPHPQFRAGQRQLAENAWRAARAGRCLMAQAPTGIGKTLGTLFPVLKACAEGIDRVFFLAARTPGRALALHALRRLQAQGGRPLRVLELTARDKACEHPDKACHGESCPLAKGFWDRLPPARAAALAVDTMDAPALRQVALAHQVCPYWLSHEMVRWADVVVGDYNYWFDASALLHALAVEREWRCAVLVDEAHNLVERGRDMYSAALDERQLDALRQSAPAALRTALQRLSRAWRVLSEGLPQPFTVLDSLPGRFVSALQQASAAIADHLAQAPPDAGPLPALQQFHFDLLAFLRLAETFGDHSQFDLALQARARRPAVVATIRNLLPAPHLAPRFHTARSTVLFSATLAPADYYRDMLGLPTDTVEMQADSPFSASQLQVRLATGISTRWSARERSVDPIAHLIARQWHERPGNYLAFFSSYDYLRQVASRLEQAFPEVPCWQQSAGMREAERDAFLDRFQPGGSGVGFAVLGGSFGEGIDLPGDRLVGAFVATLGLPQVNEVNERLRRRLEQDFGRGFDYAYLYPGLRKVVQAAGRVIRTPEDEGVLWLIDDRFARPDVRSLLPAWWRTDGAASGR